MSNLAYMVWFVGTALGTIAIVTTRTLAAAGILTRRRRVLPTLPPKGQRAGRGRHDGALFGDLQSGRPLQG